MLIMKSKKSIKLLIFDLDGTLIDSAPDLHTSINYTLKIFNKEEIDIDTVRRYIGDGAKMLVTRALSGGEDVYNEEEVQRALKVFMDNYKKNSCNKTYLYDGVKETLEKLSHKKVIVTNKPYEFVEPILEKLGIKHFFEFWIGGDSLDEKKPSSKPLLYVCDKLNINPKNTVMIGDSKNDIFAAKNANIKSVGVTYGYEKNIKNYKPDLIVNHFKELLTLI